jgi:hypothetical protein
MRQIVFTFSVVLVFMVAVARGGADVQQWDIFELSLPGPSDGNPFVDVTLSARFTCGERAIEVRGFYDGGETYRVRFIPDANGTWRYETRSNRDELNGKTGEFTCIKAAAENHGPVRVANTYHFAYADGAPFVPIGTTCYGWIHQTDALQDQTIATLKGSPFNKIRMCLLPTRTRPEDVPKVLPFAISADGKPEVSCFDVRYFHNLEKRLAQLRDLNVEADLILFHPYDEGQWGFDRMGAAADDRYVRYVVARLSAFRNVWWSLANEFDLVKTKDDADWDRLFQIVQSEDPSSHLRSIHHSQRMYDSAKLWLTHLSVQNGIACTDFGRAVIYRQLVAKPVVFDEVKYEGNGAKRWGQLSGEELVLRFWTGTIAGTYVGHGEIFMRDDRITWLSKGGVLRGESPKRIAFLRDILSTAPATGIDPIDQYYETHIGGKAGEYYLVYFGAEKPKEWRFELPRQGLSDGMKFRVDVIDTWNMTITPIDAPLTIAKHSEYTYRAAPEATIALPGQPYMALRITKVGRDDR